MDAVPIVVESTTADYFVLYVRPDLEADREIPVSVTLGEDGETTLTDQLSALPVEHYRVEKYPVDDPGDVDLDCIHDIDELADMGTMNPFNRAAPIDPDVANLRLRNGTIAIPDRETFEQLSYQGTDVWIDRHLTNLEFVKFFLILMNTDRPGVYFMNTVMHRCHCYFAAAVAFPSIGVMRGEIVYHPNIVAPDGSLGVYRFEFEPRDAYPFETVQYAYEVLAASMPLLENNLAYYPMPAAALPLYHKERASYDNSRVNVLFEEDIFPDVAFLSLNKGTGYGLLRVMSQDERPNPRDVVIYESLPNELSRVAGIITSVPQTLLSHVNLRAIQDGVPNAFIRGALDKPKIDALIDRYVHYTVTATGYTIRAATRTEIDNHFASSRPAQPQTPQRDLSVTVITPLSQVGFDDWDAFGVKAANVAVLGTLGFPDGTVPDGFAIPFYFYDEFMKHNDFYTRIETMLADSGFQTDYGTQEEELKELRDAIKDGTTPDWIITALEEMHAEFPDGTSLRYRSSTNNEDLPGFSGAGLYDSKTQDPDETEEDGIDKSIKGVWASLWNFRAFVERDFHRIDHNATSMGVLVHPNYSDELANGVAVSFDPVYGRDGHYYVNSQLGEDLVTNPDALSLPEELLLSPNEGGDVVLATSNQVALGQLLMSDAQLTLLRAHIQVIHDEFKKLYKPGPDEPFAMEIEFKITSENILAIKQARPWVFGVASAVLPNRAPVFTEGASTYRIVAETTASGVNIGAPVAASDRDSDALTYSLSGADADSFDIDASSGQLQTKTALDYESKSSYSVTVSVRDSKDDEGNPDTTTDSTIAVTILVTEVNEVPVFPSATATRTISENTPAGVNIGAPVAATDPNSGDTLTYSLGGTDADSFYINFTSGHLLTKTALDYESKSSYSVTVSVRDSKDDEGNPDTTTDSTIAVTILVTKVTKVTKVPVFPSATATRTISENTPAGVNIGNPLAATDPDNDTLTYSLGGPDAASFDIDTSSGQLQTKAALDHEAKPEYSVTVIATDASSLMAELEVTITIGNVEEEGSVALFPAQPRVGTVLRATLSDQDGELRSVNWLWERSSDQTNWTSLSGSGASYRPKSGDVGQYIRAQASYQDGEGAGKTAEAVSDHAVGAREAAPDITVVELVSGLSIPWDLAFTPDGTMLFTQRSGVLSARLTDGTVQTVTADFGDLYASGEAGLMAIVIDPSFASNRRFYTCQTHAGPTVQVIAWTINVAFTVATRVNDPLVGGIPAARFHDGCRLRFGPQGYLWIATGDGASGTVPQDLTSLGGKVLRVDASTGAGAPGNPFASSPRVYTYGHRNPQGLTRRPGTSQMWSVEHGPNIDDEINLLVKGGNYGWDPVPGYNQAVPMTDLGQFPGALEARWSSGDPTLATSGGIFLDGDDWDEWEGRLAVATLKASELHIFDFTPNGTFVSQVVVLELDGTYGRLRTPMMGPDGALYLTTSNGSGDRILKVVPSLPPTFPGETDTQAVDENRSASTIVATVTATDPEGQALTYTLSGPDAASFNLASAARGQLRANSSLDHETRSSYEVIVTASDPYGLSDSVTLTITVTDVDEPPDISFAATGGVIVNNNELSVDENYDGTLATFSARDPENTGIELVLTGTDSEA